jgi:hypothetical protein
MTTTRLENDDDHSTFYSLSFVLVNLKLIYRPIFIAAIGQIASNNERYFARSQLSQRDLEWICFANFQFDQRWRVH